MSKMEREEFIKEFFYTMLQSILDKNHKIPKEWSGKEIKKYIAYKFSEQAFLQIDQTKFLNDINNLGL